MPKGKEKGTHSPSDSKFGRLMRFVGMSKTVPPEVKKLSDDLVVIVVMGPTGAGKSSFIAAATGFNTGIGHGLETRTTKIKLVKHESHDRSDFEIAFVDTPGYDCFERKDMEVLEMISAWMETHFQRKTTLAGIIYFHRISDNRANIAPLKNLRIFKDLCGPEPLRKVILTTTMWDEVNSEEGDKREAELRATCWKAMLDQGSATPRFHRTQESAWNILSPFVRAANTRYSNSLQKELAEVKSKFSDTKTRKRLLLELEVLIHKQQSLLRKIREEPTPHCDAGTLETLKAECESLRRQIIIMVGDVQKQKILLGEHILRLV